MLDDNKDLWLLEFTDNPGEFRQIDFKRQLSGRLHKTEDVNNGLIIHEYYWVDETESDLVLSVSMLYDVDAAGLYERINFTATYYYTDGTVCEEQKHWSKKLTSRQKMKLHKNRRETVRLFMEATVLSFMIETVSDTTENVLALGGAFLVTHNSGLDIFVKTGSTMVHNDINSDPSTWLDNKPSALGGATIRQYIVGSLV